MNKVIGRVMVMAGMFLLGSIQGHAQAALGTVANDQTYAEFGASNTVTDANLRDHVGKVVVIYYYTPW